VAALRLAWQAGQFQPLVSKATTTELIRVLAYPKFKLTPEEQEELLADYLPFCATVGMPAKLPPVPKCRAPFDLPRTLVATNKGNRWFFVFGFEKNERANVSARELEALQDIASDLLRLSSAELDVQVKGEALQEICHDSQD
jgi:RelE toxin of RelE / RelB toxin-antitoxin system